MKISSLFYFLLFVSFLFTSCDNDNSVLDNPNINDQPKGDNKIKATAVFAYDSDEETVNENGAATNSIDGNYQTYWHSKWSLQNYSRQLFYKIDGEGKKLSYIMYYPRQDGNDDGNFGSISISVSLTDSPDTYNFVTNYDHEFSDKPAKIILPQSISNVAYVRFDIMSGYNGHAACAEMEFYESKVIDDSINTAKVRIPITPANTFIDSKLGGIGVGPSGIPLHRNFPWPVSYATYIKINESGNLSLYLNYIPNATTEGVLKVSVKGHSFNIDLPKGDSSEVTLPVGVVKVTEPGYLKINFEVESTSDNVITALGQLASLEAQGLTDFIYGKNPSDGGATSVNLWYSVPTTEDIEWFYNEITVPSGYDPVSTYYATNGSTHSYAGIQVNSPTERRIIFSVWSPYETQDPNTIPEEYKVKFISSGPEVQRNQFGNEGSGSQSLLVYPWISDVTYKILTGVKPLDNGSTQYVCYYYAPEIGEWRLMAKMERPKTKIWNTGLYSFVEDFTRSSGNMPRMGYYGNQWVRTSSGKWVEVTKATFSAPFNNRTDVAAGTNNYGIYLKSGGYFNENTPSGTVITRAAKGVAPSINFSTLPQ